VGDELVRRRRKVSAAVARLARRQLGLLTTQQARAHGVSGDRLERWARDGVLVRRYRGVYAVAGAPDGRDHRWLAILLAHGDRTMLSHRTAATLLGLEHGLDLGRVHLTTTSSRRRDLAHARLHTTRHLLDIEVETRGPFRTTSPARTVCDLAGELTEVDALRRVVAAAVRRGLVDVTSLHDAIARRQRFPGRAALRSVVAELSPLTIGTREELEWRFLHLTTRAGVPPTAVNHRVTDADGRVRYLDAVWLPEGVHAELDSRAHHGTLLDWHDDLRRENAVAIAGFHLCLRFSWWDVVERPDLVVDTIRRALAHARS
jgi:hypothetical protein